MTKETMISIINLHGLDGLYNVICNELEESYQKGFDDGYDDWYDYWYDYDWDEDVL